MIKIIIINLIIKKILKIKKKNYRDNSKSNINLQKNQRESKKSIIDKDGEDSDSLHFEANKNTMKKFKASIKYLYIEKNKLKFRYSLSKFIDKTNTAYYNCYDSTCNARGIIKFNEDNINNYDFTDIYKDNEFFQLTKKHTKNYENHSYKRNETIKNDFNNNDITNEKLKNLNYYKLFLKEFCIRNITLRKENIYQKLLEDFGDIKIELTNEEKDKIINNYKNRHNLDEEEIENINFKEIFNNRILFDRALNSVNKINTSKKNIEELILNMQDNKNYNLTNKINVEFKRKNKTYKKNIYIIMNEEMKKNISLNDNIQYFGDTTYQCVPPQNRGLKLFVLLCYNKKYNKILLCAFALIYNENYETLVTIFKFLKTNYNFQPDLFTVDFGRAGYTAIKNIFPNTRIFPCYFHLIRRLIIHLKDLKSNNKVIKRNAKNLLFNMKLLLFIEDDKIDEFIELIKDKYYSAYKKFIDYFEKTYMINKPFKDRQWNYYNYISNEDDTRNYFFTNNVCESLNRTINSFFKYSRKTFYNFELCIKKIIEFYDNHNDYIEKNISITRVLSWYCKCKNISQLYSYTDKDNIIKEYKQHFNYDLNEDDIDDINSSDDNNNISFSSSNISSNYNSNSSNEDDLNENDNNNEHQDDNDNNDNDDDGNEDNNKKEEKKNKKINKENKNKKNENRTNKNKNNRNDKKK